MSACFKCQDRHEGCHAECERYLEYKASIIEESKKQRKGVEAQELLREGMTKAIRFREKHKIKRRK